MVSMRWEKKPRVIRSTPSLYLSQKFPQYNIASETVLECTSDWRWPFLVLVGKNVERLADAVVSFLHPEKQLQDLGRWLACGWFVGSLLKNVAPLMQHPGENGPNVEMENMPWMTASVRFMPAGYVVCRARPSFEGKVRFCLCSCFPAWMWVPPLPLRLLLKVRLELGEILPVLPFSCTYIIYMNVRIGWIAPLPLRLLLKVRWELGEILPVLLFSCSRYIIWVRVHRQSSPTATEAVLEGSLRAGWDFACATVFLQIYMSARATEAAPCRLQRINLKLQTLVYDILP